MQKTKMKLRFPKSTENESKNATDKSENETGIYPHSPITTNNWAYQKCMQIVHFGMLQDNNKKNNNDFLTNEPSN